MQPDPVNVGYVGEKYNKKQLFYKSAFGEDIFSEIFNAINIVIENGIL